MLIGANLDNAQLTGANFTGSVLTDISTKGAVFCNTVMPNGSLDNSGC
ncbi:MAG: pentapeptide repeat-containing protein [Rhodobacteraceae bacterium]|nr:pentapeptide repeat-containing protein [Paracoccaceae bacterium]